MSGIAKWLLAVTCVGWVCLAGCEQPADSVEDPSPAPAAGPSPRPAPPPPPPPPSLVQAKTEAAAPPQPSQAAQPEATPAPPPHRPLTPPQARAQIERLGGRVATDQAGEVVKVFLNRSQIDDRSISLVKHLPQVKVLNLTGTSVGDAGLEHLVGNSGLLRIYAAGTNVTDEGRRKLQQAVPDCAVYR